MNGYEDVDRNMFFKLKEVSRTRGHKAALVKEQCRLDMRNHRQYTRQSNRLPFRRTMTITQRLSLSTFIMDTHKLAAKCTQLKAKHNSYASFKEEVMCASPEKWPAGVYLRKFFIMKS